LDDSGGNVSDRLNGIRNFRTLRLCLLVDWILRWNWNV
jgi:hypothetical protein